MKNILYEFTVIFRDGHTWTTVAQTGYEVVEYAKNVLHEDVSKIARIKSRELGELADGNV